MYLLKDLTNGERLWIARRRSGKTIEEMAKEYGVPVWRYKEWEKDRSGEIQPVPHAWLGGEGKGLKPNESCALARRRKNWSITQLGAKLGLSHVTVIKYEAEPMREGNPLVEFWERETWPKRSN